MTAVSFDRNLVTGVAELLDTEGVGVWRPGAVYDYGDNVAIVRGTIPSHPDRIVSLATYAVQDDPMLSECIIGLQVRTRGTKAPGDAIDLDAAVFDALHGLAHVTLGTGDNAVSVVLINRESSAPMGPDSSGRHERTSNYYVRCNRPHARLE